MLWEAAGEGLFQISQIAMALHGYNTSFCELQIPTQCGELGRRVCTHTVMGFFLNLGVFIQHCSDADILQMRRIAGACL